MMIHEITQVVGKHKRRKRLGRGVGSGRGKTSGRGHKGAGSRSGFSGSIRPTYEGGQMPYFRRIPKRGFSNVNFTQRYAVVNTGVLEQVFKDGDEVTVETLAAAHVLFDRSLPLKVLADGQLSRKLNVKANKFSAAARQKIEAAGGTCTVI